MSAWPETTLADCADWLSGGTPFKGNPTFWSGTIPWVSAKDMKSFRLYDAEDHISAEAIGNGGKVVPPGTVLLLVRGMTLHNDVPICVTMCEMAFNQDIKAIRPKPNLEHHFLAYWLLANKPALLAAVDHAGHGTGRLVTDLLKQMRVLLPPLPEQRAIASVLGALDDKIELNRRMNETLEAMAQAIFKSWFVDTTADGPPEGWCDGKLSNIADVVMGLSPDGESYNSIGEGVPLINGPVEFGEYFPVKSKWTTSPTRMAQKGDLIFCVRGSTTGRRVIADDIYCLGRGVCGIRSRVDSEAFLYQIVNFGLDRMLSKTTGSVFPSLSAPDIKGFPVVLPPREIIIRFGKIADPMVERIQANVHESRALAALRDTLLPKLLSGELRVNSTEKHLGETK